jgi:hypothetical protein
MKILFFSLIPVHTLVEKGIYADMINEFNEQGDSVDYYFPSNKPYFSQEKNVTFNSIDINENPQKQTNFIKKFFLYLEIEKKFSQLIKQSKKNYDVLIIVTPSIFQLKFLHAFRNKNQGAKVVLLLKDIFPDNAIDLGILKNRFPMNILIYYFKKLEKKLYNQVDHIGCMTPLNIKYISNKHKNLTNKLFLSPNSIKPYEIPVKETRNSLGLPLDKTILIFVGNIGLPQDPEFIKKVLTNMNDNYYFIFIGKGSHYTKIPLQSNILIINNQISQEIIDQYLINSDFGLIFLSNQFSIPNFPSKILNYINARLPILSFTNNFNDLNYQYLNRTIYLWNQSVESNIIKNNDIHLIYSKPNKKVFDDQIEEFNVSKQVLKLKILIKGGE